jgi:hypothetical protein
MRPVHRPPLLDDRQDLSDLCSEQGVHRGAARREIHECAVFALSGSPAVHPVIRDLPHAGRPTMREPACGRVVDGLEDQFFDLGGDSRRDRSVQPQPDFPRTIANSIACALIASVS